MEEIEEFITALRNSMVIPMSREALPMHSRDPKDDMFLACGLSGNCDYLIASDEDLLVLKSNTALSTSLRTKSSDIIHFLQKGITVSLIYRSKIVGQIQPVSSTPLVSIEVKSSQNFIKTFKTENLLSPQEKKSKYSKYLQERYGKNLF